MASEVPVTNRRLRLAIVTETYPPEVNGVAHTIAKVVEGLSRAGHEITLVRPSQGEADVKSPSPGLREVFVTGVPIPKYGQLKMGLPAMNRLTRLWRAQRPDVVHIVTEGPLGLSALAAARRLVLPVASEFRTNFHTYSAHYGVGWLERPIMAYLRWFHNRTGCTMVPTRALAEELTAKGLTNLRVVARGVDTRQFDPTKRCNTLRQSWGATPDSLVVLYVGRLAEEKNLPVLLAAFERIRQLRPDSKLVLVGNGPARADLERRCPHAVFAGIRKGEELARHYASGDLFLFPSLTETFGNVTPEAMASGLAVVAFNHAAASELVQAGANGVLAKPGDASQFCDLAARLATQPSEITRLRQQARATTLRLGWPGIIQEIEQVYAQLEQPTAQPARLRPEQTASTAAVVTRTTHPAKAPVGAVAAIGREVELHW
ncbi:MAG: glycoside hydrolase [Pedosphaera sp. Tous-C6FEB]|nr:MAG: glycoside hydrolase [Pedosphaera sp. Tous-C6FEB]